MMRKNCIWLLLMMAGVACRLVADNPPSWPEKAVRVNAPGLKNFYQVSRDLYRGALPGKKGVAELKKLGIQTVVNFTHDDDQKIFKDSGIAVFNLPVDADAPDPNQFKKFLTIVTDPVHLPVFVHCRHGSDRTGTAVALYRIFVQKWTTDQAIAEMVHGGFGFHRIYTNLIRFIREFK